VRRFNYYTRFDISENKGGGGNSGNRGGFGPSLLDVIILSLGL
jgi:uncharacterized protein